MNMQVCPSIRRVGYSKTATLETLERPSPHHKKIVEAGPYGLVWVESPIYALLKLRDGWEVMFRDKAGDGWYPPSNIRNLKE